MKIRCQCNTIFLLLHELAQSLQIVQAYVGGCNERLKKSNLDNEQLANVLMLVNTQTEQMSKKILSINFNEADESLFV